MSSAGELPCLDGSVVVLAEARSGSSLVMQTLRLLGMEVVGSFERPGLPMAANPRGYFEWAPLLTEGLRTPALRGSLDALRERAFKLSLKRLVDRVLAGEVAEWRALTGPSVRLLLPIRHPAEILASREVFNAARSDGRRDLLELRHVRTLLRDFGFLAQHFAAVPRPEAPLACVDYATAIEAPERYVASVAAAAGLEPTSECIASAIANITPELRRYRAEDLPQRPLEWIKTTGADRVYRRLADMPQDWVGVARELPGWAIRIQHR